MGRNVTDIIEEYLKSVMSDSKYGTVELQRSELAELFKCVPSQINYVISTRFTVERGYIVESKRGGGGYIRIREIPSDDTHTLVKLLQSWPAEMSQHDAEGVLERLARESIMTAREAMLLRTMVRREVLSVDLPTRDWLRARILKHVLQVLLLEPNEAENS